ncbi:STAS domain-containing protein [Actinocorallia sp. A-T 12471]|uniref:STAS domain-containing protein n=1 Tax=Actinocorallia sp. A-T 12471 TaxID=3089813 RepID=UPI0029CC355A|nr:STAS domain-containing protein [Actinocorallia sp. A-T 12471]MDX6738668.1 STAS domain-containing protein [Actinocorallia sp. A-T 12471]
MTEVRSEGGVAVVRPKGDVDVSTAPALRAELERMIADGTRAFVIDLADVTFLDSTGMAVFVGVWQRLRNEGGSFALAAATRRVAEPLRLTRLDRSLNLSETVEEALRGR